MHVDPRAYHDLPANPLGLAAGAVLLPTRVPIVLGGGTSLDFVREQGGDDDTFVFLFGVRVVRDLDGDEVPIVEGVFLSEDGPGFVPTWGVEQLARETAAGGWKVVPRAEVLASWTERVERRMNARD